MVKYRYYKVFLHQNQNFKIIIFFFIFIIKSINTQSLKKFKTIPLYDNNFLIITCNEIRFYNNTSNSNSISHTFVDDQIIESEELLGTVDFGRYNEENAPNLLLIKHFVYAIAESGILFGISNLAEIIGYHSSFVIPIKNSYNTFFYIIGLTNIDNKVSLNLIENPSYSLESRVSKKFIIEADSDNLSCHLIDSTTDKEIEMICFYEKSKEIIASYYYVDLTKKEFKQIYSKEKSNNGGKIIKSYLTEDKLKAFVCYVNGDNDCNCNIYDILRYQWDNDNFVYLNDCLISIWSLVIEYVDNINEFLLYCQQSSNKYNIKLLNSNFKIINNDENGIYQIDEMQFKDCNDYSVSSLLFDTLKNTINIITNCDNNISKNEITKALPSTILEMVKEMTEYISQTELVVIHEKCFNTKEDIISNLKEFLKKYDGDKIYEIFGDDYEIKISPINNKKFKSISTYINFSNCENILREKEELSSSILSLFQLEIYNSHDKSLINDVEYAVFDDKKEIIDLSDCKDETIKINYKIKNESLINITKINYYSDQGIDIFNITDTFFNDICYPYSEEDSDIILRDRISDIYEN